MNSGNSSVSFVRALLIVAVMGVIWYLFIQKKPQPDGEVVPSPPQETAQRDARSKSSAAPAKVFDTDRMMMFAATLGRAYGCGHRPEEELARVRTWLDRSLSPGTREHQAHFHDFLEGIKNNEEQQREGRSTYSCADVEMSLKTTTWP
jgi:hypothetical protein